jgi:hypothetical protein
MFDVSGSHLTVMDKIPEANAPCGPVAEARFQDDGIFAGVFAREHLGRHGLRCGLSEIPQGSSFAMLTS